MGWMLLLFGPTFINPRKVLWDPPYILFRERERTSKELLHTDQRCSTEKHSPKQNLDRPREPSTQAGDTLATKHCWIMRAARPTSAAPTGLAKKRGQGRSAAARRVCNSNAMVGEFAVPGTYCSRAARRASSIWRHSHCLRCPKVPSASPLTPASRDRRDADVDVGQPGSSCCACKHVSLAATQCGRAEFNSFAFGLTFASASVYQIMASWPSLLGPG